MVQTSTIEEPYTLMKSYLNALRKSVFLTTVTEEQINEVTVPEAGALIEFANLNVAENLVIQQILVVIIQQILVATMAQILEQIFLVLCIMVQSFLLHQLFHHLLEYAQNVLNLSKIVLVVIEPQHLAIHLHLIYQMEWFILEYHLV